jgi:hypothetical protein
MSSGITDEETPLLRSSGDAGPLPEPAITGNTPLPWRQFSIILSLQVLEPMTSQVISPFAPQVIACFHCVKMIADEKAPS